jgi:parallel beta-helix repeat protein
MAKPQKQVEIDNLSSELAHISSQKAYVNKDMTTAEIQAKADSLINGGILEFIYSNEYIITEAILLKPYTTVEGNNSKITVNSDITVFATLGLTETYSNIIIQNLEIWDNGVLARSKYHIDLKNAVVSSIFNVKIYSGTMSPSDVAGIKFSRNEAISTFVNTVEKCVLNQASIVMESSDSWIKHNTIWAYSRSFGIHVVKTSQFISENQIVGSPVHGGIYVNDIIDNFNIELLKIVDNYFDGSYDLIDSGIGIKGNKLVECLITNNDFWRQMDEAIILTSSSDNKIIGNTFKNCNRRDNSKSDIVINGGGYNIIASNGFTRQVVHTNKGKAISGTSTNNSIYGNMIYFDSYYLAPIIDVDATNKLLNNLNSNVVDTKRLPSKSILTFWQDGVAASVGLTSVNTNGSALKSYILGYNAKILAISLVVSIPRTAGTLVLTVYKNGVSTGELLTYNTGVYTMNKTFTTPITITTSDAISLRYNTDSSWLPTTLNFSASLLIEISE